MKNKFRVSTILLGLLLGVSRVFAQDVLITYQGLVTDNGTNFNGTGLFQFALVTSTNYNQQATATAILSGPFVVGYTNLVGGSGYTNAPTVTISGGGGSGATATAGVAGGIVTSINPGSAGSNYTSAPTVRIGPPPPDIAYTTLWSNDGTSSAGSEPATAVSLPVADGLLMVALGDSTLVNMTPISESLFTQSNLQLKIWFNDGTNGAAELNPVQDLTPVPYAILAQSANSFVGSFPAAQLTGVVSNAQLAYSSVTVTAGTGFGGGGAVALGGSITLSNTGVLSITGDSDITSSTNVGAVILGTTATSTNTTNTIVRRDGSGNFSAGTITLAGALNLVNALENTALGSGALSNNIAGSNNTANGWQALYANTNGFANTATGWEALYANLGGYENTADGALALFSTTTGNQNTASGGYSLYYNAAGSDNTANGWEALFSNNSGSNNLANGAFALYNNVGGACNTANGVSALYYNNGGSSNTANGYNALYNSLSGIANTANGAYALYGNNAGNYNTAEGYGALMGNYGGNNNIAIGYTAGTNIFSGNNNIDIGNAGGMGDNNIIRIGFGQSGTFIAGISSATVSGGAAVYVNSSGQLGVLTSSERFKQDIQSMGDASDLILGLRPVTFRYKPELDAKGTPQFGLIAEEVSKVDPNLVLRDDKNQIYTVRYEAVNAMLLNEFLKQHRKVEQQQAELQTLKEKVAQVDSLEKRVQALEALLVPRSDGDSSRSASAD